jgi:hypothetical protein
LYAFDFDVTTTVLNTLGVMRKKSHYRPRDKTSNLNRNKLFTPPPFKVVVFTYANEMIDWFEIQQNVLILYFGC